MRLDFRWVLPLIAYAIVGVIYWLFGGNFERGWHLGMTALFGTMFAVAAFACGCACEEHKLRNMIDKYRQ